MDKNEIVTINGQRYNAHTGMPLEVTKASSVMTPKPTPAAGIHAAPQKSQTLIRRATKKPPVSINSRLLSKPGRSMDIARSNKIARFAPHPVKPPVKATSVPDIAATTHPVVKKVHQQLRATKQATVAAQAPKSSQDIKHEAIVAALAKPAVKTPKKSFFKRNSRLINIFSIGAVIIIIGVYFTYLNMPNLSVQVAAQQAGINATYPEYRPDGYRLDGPVTYNDGQVTINFAANTGSSAFTLKQAKSSWDSSAVLDNIVRKKVGEKYITNQERGLTIYTYDGNAAWVNAGILYTIDGKAPLSSEQIRRIATSL
jgi:hypothetical protein